MQDGRWRRKGKGDVGVVIWKEAKVVTVVLENWVAFLKASRVCYGSPDRVFI